MPVSPHLKAVRAKVGHDLLTLTAASISIFDEQQRLLLAEDADTGLWTLPGGAVDPNETPSDAAVLECWEETGLLVRPTRLIGVFGGSEFLVTYPNGDVAYYTSIVFEVSVIGGSHQPDGIEIAKLQYFTAAECERLALSPPSRVIAVRSFARDAAPYFANASWTPRS